jgi:hypothetical protein
VGSSFFHTHHPCIESSQRSGQSRGDSARHDRCRAGDPRQQGRCHHGVGPLSSRITADAIAAASREREAPSFLAIDTSEAIAQRYPVYESTEIPAGAFGGAPPRPAEAVETIGVSHYIVAHRSLGESAVGEFARLLFGARQALSTDVPAASRTSNHKTGAM